MQTRISSIRNAFARRELILPAVCLGLGLAMVAAHLIGGDPSSAAFSFAVMAALAAVIAFGGRSETIGLMRRPDERWSTIDLRATAISGSVVLSAITLMFLVEVAQGEDPTPYLQLGAIGGVAYAAALLWLRRRS